MKLQFQADNDLDQRIIDAVMRLSPDCDFKTAPEAGFHKGTLVDPQAKLNDETNRPECILRVVAVRVSKLQVTVSGAIEADASSRFVDDGEGRVRALLAHEVEMVEGRFQKIEGTDFEIEADYVFLAMGFTGPESAWITEQFGVELDARSNVARNDQWSTNVPGVYVAGDMGRGQSLIVWAIAEGRACAAAVDQDLMGRTLLPSPVTPTAAPLR